MKESTKERFSAFLWYAICIIFVLLLVAALVADIALYWGKFKFFVLD